MSRIIQKNDCIMRPVTLRMPTSSVRPLMAPTRPCPSLHDDQRVRREVQAREKGMIFFILNL